MSMKTILGMGMALALALTTMGCGKASCDEAAAASDAAECMTAGDDVQSCMEKLAKKYAHCKD
jgi:hypothetical protein